MEDPKALIAELHSSIRTRNRDLDDARQVGAALDHILSLLQRTREINPTGIITVNCTQSGVIITVEDELPF